MIVQRILAILLGLFLIFFVTIIGLSYFIYPTLVTEKMKVDALWVPAEKTLLERQQLLVKATSTFPEAATVQAAMEKVQRAEVRTDFAPDVPEQFAFYRDAERDFADLGRKLLERPDVAPETRAQLAELEKWLAAEQAAYDAAAAEYNVIIARRPASIVATVFKFLPKGRFADQSQTIP